MIGLSARFVRAALAFARSIPNVPPTTSGRGWRRLVETGAAPSLSPSTELSHASWSLRLHFPASLGSTGVTPLHGYYGHSDSRRAALRALGAMNTGLSSTAGLPVYLVHSSNRSVPNHPTVSPSVICFRSRFISERRGRPVDPVARGAQREVLPRGFGSRLRTAVAGSPIGLAESDSRSVMSLHVMSLRTGCSSPAAPHPVLPRRSSLRLQTGERSVWQGLSPCWVYAFTGARPRRSRRFGVTSPGIHRTTPRALGTG